MAKISKGDGPSQDNFAGNPTTRATTTAKFVQSYDEIAIRTEEPAPSSPLIPRGNPARDPKQAAVGEADRIQGYDDAQNTRAQPQTYFRDTPPSEKGAKDQRPDWLYRYTDHAGEQL